MVESGWIEATAHQPDSGDIVPGSRSLWPRLGDNKIVDFILHPAEVRVLGSLLEKDITTPEYYPLTLNALLNACNQKSNRDPMVSYDEPAVTHALDALKTKGFVTVVTGAGNRVPKYAHRISDRLNLGRRELALICELMVRGPQTLGELRTHAARMYDFSDLEEVETCLNGMMERAVDPLVTRLPRQSGTKEERYAHLLSGEPAPGAPSPSVPAPSASSSEIDRVSRLESEVSALRSEVQALKEQFEKFQKQFE
jgi:hypothetical protein